MESQKVHAKFGCDCRKRRPTLLSHDTTIKIAVKIGNCNFRTTLPPTTAAADHYNGTYDLCLTRLNGTILQSHIKGPYFYYDSTLRSFHNLIGQLNAPRKKSQMTNNGPSVRNSRSMWRVTQIGFAWCSWNKNNLHSRARALDIMDCELIVIHSSTLSTGAVIIVQLSTRHSHHYPAYAYLWIWKCL